MYRRRAHHWLTLLLSFTMFGAAAARADALDGLLEVRSAYAVPDQGGVYQLFARITYPVNDDIRARDARFDEDSRRCGRGAAIEQRGDHEASTEQA